MSRLKLVVIKTQFEAIHRWPEAEGDVRFLIYPHRHVFHITVKWEVNHNNRDIEFIREKRKIDEYLKSYPLDIGQMSCEDIAEDIMNKFKAVYVSVFEDGENGAEVYQPVLIKKD